MRNLFIRTLKLSAALVLTACATIGCNRAETSTPPLTPVKAYQLTATEAKSSARYSGNIEPETQVDVSFKRSGKVLSVHAEEGDVVTKGAVLAVLEQEDFFVKVSAAEGQLQEAAASLKKAEADYKRAQSLFDAQSMIRPDYDAAVAQYEVSVARKASAQAQLDDASNARADATLHAPLSGIVLRRNVEIGTLAAAGQPAFVVADVSSMKAVFGVNDTAVQKLQRGSAIAISTESLPGKHFAGTITSISPSADPVSRVFDLEVTVSNTDRSLKPGMIATMAVNDESTATARLLIPFSAVVSTKSADSQYAVYRLMSRAGHPFAQLQAVTLGDVYGDQVELTRGLSAGDRIVTQGSAMLTNGQEVTVEE